MNAAACAGVIEQWHTPEGTAKHHAALARLLQLRVLEAAPTLQIEQLKYSLHPALARHLRSAVYAGWDHIFEWRGCLASMPYGLSHASVMG